MLGGGLRSQSAFLVVAVVVMRIAMVVVCCWVAVSLLADNVDNMDDSPLTLCLDAVIYCQLQDNNFTDAALAILDKFHC